MPNLLPRKVWTDEQIAQLQARYPHEQTSRIADDINHPLGATYRKAQKLGLKKTQQYLSSPAAGRMAAGSGLGSASRFESGRQTWNKGMNFQAGGRSAETQFRAGNKPKNYLPVGSERISSEGYLQRKMTDTGYPPHDWVSLHVLEWKTHNGAVPPKHAIIFRDGNRKNYAIDNLECISRVELMRRNTVHRLPKDLAKLAQLRGALTRQINKRTHHEQ